MARDSSTAVRTRSPNQASTPKLKNEIENSATVIAWNSGQNAENRDNAHMQA